MIRTEQIPAGPLSVKREWDDLLARSEICDAFQTYEWASVLQNSIGVQPCFFFVKNHGRTLGGVIVLAKRILGMVNSLEIRGGPIYDKGSREVVMRSILKAVEERRKKAVNLLFVPFPPINHGLEHLFRTKGYYSYPFRTIIIDLSRKLEDVWKSLSKKARWGVRKAERVGLEVKEADTWDEWEHYYRLHLQHGREKQYPTEPLQFFREMFKLGQRNMAHLFLAEHEKHMVAGSLFLMHKQNMVFLQNASETTFLSQNPNSLLQWKSIEWAKENGVTIYDMNGLPPKEVPYLQGVFNFKRQWDGQTYWYYYYLNRRLLHTTMHLIRTNGFAWKLFMSTRNLRIV